MSTVIAIELARRADFRLRFLPLPPLHRERGALGVDTTGWTKDQWAEALRCIGDRRYIPKPALDLRRAVAHDAII